MRTSKILKIISYILIPILVLIIGISTFHIMFLNKYAISNEIEYTKTKYFAEDYLYVISSKIQVIKNYKNVNYKNFLELEDSKGKKIYYYDNEENYDYYSGIEAFIDYIIVDKENEEIYTNMKSDDYEAEIPKMKDKKFYWEYTDRNIETNIKYMDENSLKYNSNFQYSNITGNIENINEKYNIYTFYNEEKVNQINNFKTIKTAYQFMLQNQKLPIYVLPISIALLGIILIYLLWSIGYEKGKEGIALSEIDKIPFEIVAIIGGILLTTFLTILINIINAVNYILIITGTIIYIICYCICAVISVTIIKRIKAKRFFKSFLTYSILKWIVNQIRKLKAKIEVKIETKEIFWYYLGFVVISIILAMFFMTGIMIIVLIAFWIWVYFKIKAYIEKQENIKNALKDIYNGKKDVYINEENLKGTLKEMAIYVNDISDGFSNAIEENLKSERLKTELITNVSHDIRTPLTSIINYVDLLKNENIEDEKVKEYIEILDKKSKRLKKLTEDLIEASKASSGNIKFNIEEIKIKELINQTIGEFKDKFEEKGLLIETKMPESELKINADSRYIYRIIENLFSNITKYAQENTRVYIDITEENSRIRISIKNISKESLNISADELMQRFVRGDKSRYTEGSGLRIVYS